MATLKRAFDGQNLPALVVKILRGKYPRLPSRYSPSLKLLVDRMLKQNPKDRPSVDEMLRQGYVQHHLERYATHVAALALVNPLQLGGLVEQTVGNSARPRSNKAPPGG